MSEISIRESEVVIEINEISPSDREPEVLGPPGVQGKLEPMFQEMIVNTSIFLVIIYKRLYMISHIR